MFPIEAQKRYFPYINDIFNNIQQNNQFYKYYFLSYNISYMNF